VDLTADDDAAADSGADLDAEDVESLNFAAAERTCSNIATGPSLTSMGSLR
jgi:hypothetical protein